MLVSGLIFLDENLKQASIVTLAMIMLFKFVILQLHNDLVRKLLKPRDFSSLFLVSHFHVNNEAETSTHNHTTKILKN